MTPHLLRSLRLPLRHVSQHPPIHSPAASPKRTLADSRPSRWRITLDNTPTRITPWQYLLRTTQAFLFLHLFFTYGYSLSMTAGASMLPTLNISHDLVLISKHHRRGRDIHVGDVIGFDHPVKNQRGPVPIIKRVVGMPGDFVLAGTPGVGRGEVLRVPEGHCWVVGDNMPASRDSRMFGPLPLALVQGKIVARVWPGMKWLGNGMREADWE